VRAWDGEGGVIPFSVAYPLFPTAGLARSAAAKHGFNSYTLMGISQRTRRRVRQLIRKHAAHGGDDPATSKSSSRIDALSDWSSITL
jgi:hypothetical protein